jgi:predicted RNA-binding protein YlxR (DUF448 family)
MARARHVPIRTCVGCRTAGDKRGLLRVVRLPDGGVAYDPSGKAAGRGAYVCASHACIRLAARKRILERHLRQPVAEEVYEALMAAAEERGASASSATGPATVAETESP